MPNPMPPGACSCPDITAFHSITVKTAGGRRPFALSLFSRVKRIVRDLLKGARIAGRDVQVAGDSLPARQG